MSNSPNLSPAISIGIGIAGAVVSIVVFAFLPSLPQTAQNLSFLFFGFLPLSLSAVATVFARKIGVNGYLTGIISVHLGVTLPSTIVIGYYILWLNRSYGLRFLLDILQFGFVFVFLVIILTVVAVLGAMPFIQQQANTES